MRQLGMNPIRRLRFLQLPGRRHHCHAAITRLMPGVSTAAHTHDFPECFLVLAGAGWHCTPRGRAALSAGQLVWVEPADVHWFATDEAPLEFFNLALAPAWWRRCATLAQPRLQPGTNRERPCTLDAATWSRLDAAVPALLGEHGERGSRLLAWLGLAAEALSAPSAVEPGRSAPPEWLAALLRDLDDPQKLVEPIGWWQRRSGRSKEHLARACRRFCGASLTELLQRARITRAQRLLATGEAKVTTTAFAVGFGHLGNFHAVFKRQTGLTPRQWQRRHAATVPREG